MLTKNTIGCIITYKVFNLKIYCKGSKKQMNNILKKVSAVALSFTLLGAGTIVANTISPKSTTSLVAHANSAYYWRYCTYLSQHYSTERNAHVDVYAELYRGSFTGYYKHVEGNRTTYQYNPGLKPC